MLSNTVFELKIPFSVADLEKSFKSFSNPDRCHALEMEIIRGFKPESGYVRRTTSPKGGSLKFATSSYRPEDDHGKRFICDAIVTEITSGIESPIAVDDATEKATKLPGIRVGSHIHFFADTGSGRGDMISYDADNKDNAGNIQTAIIVLATPDDLPFDDDHRLMPACMAETIDESKLFAPSKK